jgi:DNA repair protein RecO (recombination protein O)
MSAIKTQALVIKSFDWQDTSRIISLYTREAGKLKVIARGARRLKSAYQGMLETMNLVEALIHSSEKRQIQILGQLSLENSFSPIKRDYDKTGYAYAILEVADHFLQESEADPVFFDFLVTILGQLAAATDNRIVFWFFLLKVCSYLGFRPNFSSCSLCEREVEDEVCLFSMREGCLQCGSCGQIQDQDWQLPRPVREFLARLQRLSHRRLAETAFKAPGAFPYTDFLIAYLRFHSDENLVLASLKIFK